MSKEKDTESLMARFRELTNQREVFLQELGKTQGKYEEIIAKWKKKGITEKNIQKEIDARRKKVSALKDELDEVISKLEKGLAEYADIR